MRPMSRTLTRWFIAVVCAEKLKRFPNPDKLGLGSNTGADTNPIRAKKHLTKKIIHLAARLSNQTDLKCCIAVPKKIH